MNNTGKKYVGSEVANKDIGSEAPRDPNEIIGLEGYNAPESTDTLRWVSATQSLAYTIYFENDAELAMAAASKVTITVPLHDKLNYATFGVGSFGFGSHIIAVEGSPSSYQTRIDLRDSMGIYLDVVAGLDIVHNEAFWIFQSIDPATGLPPTDIHLGFLPINDSLHSGEGFVTCTIKPKAGECVTGDTVSATASIVFDVNEAIATNTWLNTIDAFAPTSTLTITPNAAGDMLTATFAGEDDEDGCGIKQYKLYYSVNGSSYQLYDVYLVGDTAEIPVETGMKYEFFTLAEDNVGNCEPMKTQPEYNIGTNFVTLAVNSFPAVAGSVTGGGTYSVNDTAQLTATVAEGYHFVSWMSQGVPVSTENPYSAVVSQNQTFTAYFERNAYTLQTIADMGSFITVTDLNGNEVPSGSTVLHFDQLIVSTDTADCYAMESELLNGAAYVPGDTLTVTGNIALSTTTESLLTQTDTTATACDSFVWYGETLTETTDYTKTFTNVAGCDSIVILHLTVTPSTTGDTTAVVCDSFNWYGTTCISSGNYTRTLTNVAGCDSVVTLHLNVNHSVTELVEATACDSYSWNGTTYTQSGDYTQTFTAANGCDSVVTLHLTVNHSVAELVEVTACGSYVWNNSVYTQSGDYAQTLTAANGCDSVVTLHLTVAQGTYTETTVDTCGTQYFWAVADTTVTQSGTYYHYSTNANTCTDTAVLILLLYQPATTEISAQICAGEVYNQNGFNVSTAGDYQLNLQTVHGCDSAVILHLTVGSETVTYLTASICEGDSYNENGFVIFAPAVGTQVYFDTIARPGACDSVVTLTLMVNAVTSGDTTAVVNSSFDWYGQHLTTTGDYTHTLTNAVGCDSLVTLHLTINYTNTGDTTAVACDSFDWYEHTNLTQSGDYVHVFTNAAGGDSVVTLHLTVNSSIFLELSETTCDAYSWNGIAYTQSGDYTQTFTAANGCDSVVTLHLTLIEMPVLQAITGESEICINQYATYHYDISYPNYQYRWFKDNVLWAENVPVMTLHEMNAGVTFVTMQVADEQSGCSADTSLTVQIVNRIAPDTTEIRRKGNTNILICQPVYSDYGQVHYRWGYTDLNTTAEVVMQGDRNYCLYDFGIDTLSYHYWVETYLNNAIGEGCDNRSYYAYGYITTATPDYGGNIVEAYLSNSRIVLYVSSLSPDDITASLYDVNGKLLLSKDYGITDQVSDVIPVSIAPGVYFLRVSLGGQLYSIKLLKI